MIKPRIDTLIRGVAEGLEKTVLPEVSQERARRQLRDGLRLLRRLADGWGEILPTLRHDNRDIATTLTSLSGELDDLGARPDRWRDVLDRDPAEEADDLDMDTLTTRNEALQQLLVEVHARLGDCADDARRRGVEERLRALYRRSLERERLLAKR